MNGPDLKIVVRETAGIARDSEMVTVGVPVSRGAIAAEAPVAIRGPHNQVQTCQSKVLKQWPDGSVKWLLVDFAASTGAGTSAEYEVVPGVEPPPAQTPVIVTLDSRTCEVDTGSALFVVDRNAYGPFSAVRIKGKDILQSRPGSTVLRIDGIEDILPVVDAVDLEESGPLRAVIRLSGRFHGTPGRRPRFFSRLYFMAGSSAVKIEFTVHNPYPARHSGGLWDLGDEGSFLFRNLTFSFHCSDPAGELCCTPAPSLPVITLPATSRFSLYQESSGGEQWRSPVHRNRNGVVPMEFCGYMAEVDGREAGTGRRATPLLWKGAGEVGVALAVPRLWQEFPGEVAWEEGMLQFSPFPARFPDLHELQGGEQKTYEFWVDFATSKRGLSWALEPLRAYAVPDTYRESGVLKDLPGEDDLVDLFTSPAELLQKREIADEFGWRNFGDIYADHETAYHQRPELFVSHYNNQYDFVAGLYRKFFATGDVGWQELAADLARHVRDIDLYHTDEDREEYNHGMFWHTDHYVDAGTSNHRSCSKAHLQVKPAHLCGGGPGAEHCYTTGLMLHYFQTGNPVFRDAVLSLARWELLALSGPQTVLAALKRAVGNLNLWRTWKGSGRPFPQYPLTRGTGNAITACIDAFEVDGDREFLDRAEDLIRKALHPEDDIQARDLLDAEVAWSYTILLAAVVKFLDKKLELEAFDDGFAHARGSILAYAQWMAANEYPYLDKPEILEYPNETWAAQDIRKSVVFYGAARYACAADQRARLLEQAKRYYVYARNELQRHGSSRFSRPVVLMLQNGWVGSRLTELPPAGIEEGGTISGATTPKVSLATVARRTVGDLLTVLGATTVTREAAWLKARLKD